MEKSKKARDFLQQPQYPGGDKALTEFIYKNLRYPEAALAAEAEGVVLVEYDIDRQGLVTDARVLHGIGHGCDEEACRVVRMLKFDVGKNRGLHVIFHKKARIQFKKQPAPAVVAPPAPEMPMQYVFVPPPPAADAPAKTASTTYTYTFDIS